MTTLFPLPENSTPTPSHAMPEAYLPLYRKYRPQALNQLVGQEAMAQALSNAISLNQVSHAYLLTGPRGTGKTSTARIFAKSLNCVEGPTATPCQVCDACLNITAGNGLDVIEFDAASNNGVEQARELIESCQFAPIAGRYKIYIIDEVHMLSKAAFNALLKTLEEPPPNVIFIFATTEAHRVLPTILSRCQRFDFKRIALAVIHKHLQWVCEQEQLSIADDALLFIARSAKGGMRDALSMLDQTAVLARSEAHAGQPLALETLVAFLGYLSEDKLVALLSSVAKKEGMVVLETLHAILQQGVDAFQIVKQLLQVFRQLLLLLTTNTQKSPTNTEELLSFLDCSSMVLEGLQQVKTAFSPEEIPQLLRQFQAMEADMRHASDPSGVLELGLLSLTFREKTASVEGLQNRLAELESALSQLQHQLASGGGFVPSAVAPPPAMVEAKPAYSYSASGSGAMPPPMGGGMPNPPASMPAPVVASVNQPKVASSSPTPMPTQGGGDLGLLTQQITGAIKSLGAKALFNQHAQLISSDAGKLVFGVSSAAILTTIQTPDKLIHIKKAAELVFNHPVSIAFTTDKTLVKVVEPPVKTVAPTKPVASPQPEPLPAKQASFETLDAIPFEETPSPVSAPPPPKVVTPSRPPANGMPAPLGSGSTSTTPPPVAKKWSPNENDDDDLPTHPDDEGDLWGEADEAFLTGKPAETLVEDLQPPAAGYDATARGDANDPQAWDESVGFAKKLLNGKVLD
ncbi:MAG: DNA polymerase III subunit gamma/tau [Candidatus Melainabacteria bacterium]|nr:DNA polymerase III subunit gamma/tau [Candidatus Melainabacteria bacterium]